MNVGIALVGFICEFTIDVLIILNYDNYHNIILDVSNDLHCEILCHVSAGLSNIVCLFLCSGRLKNYTHLVGTVFMCHLLIFDVAAVLFMEETLRKNSESTSPSSSNGNSPDIDNRSVDTNIEMVTLTAESDDDLHEPDVEEHEFSDTDTLVQESDTTNTQKVNGTGYLKQKLMHTDFLHPFKLFYRTQKEQLLQCCLCFVRNPSTPRRSLKQYMSPKFVFKTITGRFVLMLKLMLDRRVVVSVLTYAFVGGVTVMSNEVCDDLL